MGPIVAILTGQTDSHTVDFFQGLRVHREVEKSLRAMADEAAKAGFQLQVVSGYRSYQRQLEIWNAKATGKRPVVDADNRQISPKDVSEEELIHLILRWSALPGTSRHHWGTDLDIIDGSKVTSGMKVKLVPEEFDRGGPFSKLHDWLDKNMGRFGFFRPYESERGGVSPERWHLSHAPIAQPYLKQLTEEMIFQVLNNSELELKSSVLKLLPEIFRRYVQNIDLP